MALIQILSISEGNLFHFTTVCGCDSVFKLVTMWSLPSPHSECRYIITLPDTMKICSSAFLYPSSGFPLATVKSVGVYQSVRTSDKCHWFAGMPANRIHQSQCSDWSLTDGKRAKRKGMRCQMHSADWFETRGEDEISLGLALVLLPVSQTQAWPF